MWAELENCRLTKASCHAGDRAAGGQSIHVVRITTTDHQCASVVCGHSDGNISLWRRRHTVGPSEHPHYLAFLVRESVGHAMLYG